MKRKEKECYSCSEMGGFWQGSLFGNQLSHIRLVSEFPAATHWNNGNPHYNFFQRVIEPTTLLSCGQ